MGNERILYRGLDEHEISRALFAHFIRHQTVGKCWRRDGEQWVIRDDPFVDDWSEADYGELIDHLKQVSCSGGFVLAGFLAGRLKGFVSVDSQWLGNDREYLDLTNLHVSEDVRRQGIGKALFLAAADWARARGAKKLYLSAHSAVESQAFYRDMGCTDAQWICEEHAAAEPFDCQMEYKL